MTYITTVLNFLNDYSIIILPILYMALFVYAIVNWVDNPYRRQNKKLVACYKGLCAYPDKLAKYAGMLPEDYRRQWRACVNSNTKPSLVFEFVPKRKSARMLWLFVPVALVGLVYVAVFFVTKAYYSYLIFQLVFWLTFGLVTVASKAVERHQTKRAKQLFAKLVTMLNRTTPLTSSEVLEDTVKQLQKLNKHQVNDSVIGKASELLRNKGLDTSRSVEQQRKLNNALNGLLQAYSRNAHLAGGATK